MPPFLLSKPLGFHSIGVRGDDAPANKGIAMDMVSKIISYESGEMNEEEMIAFFKELVEKGVIYHLQGHYQRTAMSLGLL